MRRADAPLPRSRARPAYRRRLGVRPMPSRLALDARLALIASAHHLARPAVLPDRRRPTGRLILRELRDAALRGVRVRLLLDDLYTKSMDDLLLGLAAHAERRGAAVQPFVHGRDSLVARGWSRSLRDFGRLNHRMHNKLFVADGAWRWSAAATWPTSTSCAARQQLHRLRPADGRRRRAAAQQALRRLLEQRPGLSRCRPSRRLAPSAAERARALQPAGHGRRGPGARALTGADMFGRATARQRLARAPLQPVRRAAQAPSPTRPRQDRWPQRDARPRHG